MFSRQLTAITALSLVCAFGAGCPEEPEPTSLRPQVNALSKETLAVGETLFVVGNNFMPPDEGYTLLEFEGVYYWTDEDGTLVPEDVPSFTIRPLYDGKFEEAGAVGEARTSPGNTVLRWNRFGPYEVPFGGGGRKPGIFKGTVTAMNVPYDGDIEPGDAREIALEIKPSILVTKLEPVIGETEDGRAKTPGCDAPALRVFGNVPYILEVEAMGFEPAYWIYEIANVNGELDFVRFTHTADGQVDRLGDPDTTDDEILVFNQLPEDVEFAIASIKITAVDADDNPIYSALPVPIVRPLAFHYNGKRPVAEYYEPVPVHGPIMGGIGTVVTYAESESESRQRAVSVSFTQNVSNSVGQSVMQNWSEGYGVTNTQSNTNAQGVTVSEAEASTEAYGTTYSQSDSTNMSMSSSSGTDWGWNMSEGTTQEEFAQQMDHLFGTVSGEVSTEVNGGASIPGVANVGGSVGSTVGAAQETGQEQTQGQRVGSSSQRGSSMTNRESETETYGSVTTDAVSESVSGSYGVSRQQAINSTRSETEATAESVTYEMGGSQGLTESYTVGSSESWGETWTSTTTKTQLFSISARVPNPQCAVVYRQTVRYVRQAQLYQHDLCGVRTLMSELNFNEWSWSPEIALGPADECQNGDLPKPSMPEAECFFACD